MKNFVLTAFITLLLAQAGYALTIAEAKALPIGTNVTIGPITLSTVQDITGSSYACAAQDDTGGVTLYGSTAQDLVTVSNFVAGDSITIQAETDEYSDLFELTDITLVEYHGFDEVPTPIDITIQDLQSGAPNATAYQSMLVKIQDVEILAAGVFSGGSNYTITNLTDSMNGVIRIQDFNDPLVGTTIPQGNVAIIGILSTYFETPQLLPLEIIPDAPLDDPNIVAPSNVIFGTVYPGYPRTLNIKIDNGGVSNDLILTAFSGTSGNFTILSNNFPFSIGPGNYLLLPVQYDGGSTWGDTHAVSFTAYSNDSSETNTPILLEGRVADRPATNVWINEFDYDTPGSWSEEEDEFVELCGVAGISISNWSVVFWDGFGGVNSNYGTHVIGDFTFADEDNGYGFFVLGSSDSPNIHPDEVSMIPVFENRSPVAVQLLDADGNQVHFAEYGAYSASDFPGGWPDDLTSDYDSGLSNSSVNLIGTAYERLDFSWAYITTNSPGTANVGQVLLPEPALAYICLAGFLLAIGTKR
jgi:hypothetical protein